MSDTVYLVIVVVSAVLLAAGASLAVARAERGPSMLDRTIALDVFTTTLVGAIALEAAFSRRTDTIPILVVLSLVGFVGSVTIARFASVEPEDEGRIRTAEEIAAEDAARREAEESDRDSAVDAEHHGGAPDGEVR
ncbi:monovalent cation/H+ antiporter complex subunit F [Cellulosimicrobium funkei]|uniref:pH regulation protein F n=1 Tax=Cellulosimicrobium funkei TaxID=264251 RepID=A0A4Y8R3J6_9MICO|nr:MULTISPECIES: monovalent cation/H+ antiporter complex subunit F [Cellulosimicrobium]MCM3533344.1 monovalent cation/H+ antiporter complex subunit F [Cellulosimicrobium funkei]MDQ8041365.1 monovalent cation/H+ antiporter complex subunit F [Cellulosimicrobium sp. XJ-DQ-B-000]TFF12729.1 pH regulation protein F [Cellulosimicrobium funkei]TGA77150.1 pH regulation protein F [Cellulosimicrobium terreum]